MNEGDGAGLVAGLAVGPKLPTLELPMLPMPDLSMLPMPDDCMVPIPDVDMVPIPDTVPPPQMTPDALDEEWLVEPGYTGATPDGAPKGRAEPTTPPGRPAGVGTVKTTIALGTPGVTRAASQLPGIAAVPVHGWIVVSTWPNAGMAQTRRAAPKTMAFIGHLHTCGPAGS